MKLQSLRRQLQANGSKIMRIFIFKSETGGGLCAFAADSDTNLLPSRHGPWHVVGVVRADANPPYNLRRDVIEQGIANHGYQMFRIRKNPGVNMQQTV